MKTFKIYPDLRNKQKKFFYKVIIFPTMKKMYEYRRKQCKKSGGIPMLDFAAITQPYKIIKFQYGKEIEGNCIGYILFCKERMGGGIISHEMCHATINYAKEYPKYNVKNWWSKVSKKEVWEEIFCDIQGGLVAQFWENYFKIYRK